MVYHCIITAVCNTHLVDRAVAPTRATTTLCVILRTSNIYFAVVLDCIHHNYVLTFIAIFNASHICIIRMVAVVDGTCTLS